MRITIKEMYEQIIAKASEVLTPEEITFLKERAEKNSRGDKLTAKQKENNSLKAKIADYMEIGKGYTVTDIVKEFALSSQQKGTPLLNQLVDEGVLEKKVEKGVALFFKVEG